MNSPYDPVKWSVRFVTRYAKFYFKTPHTLQLGRLVVTFPCHRGECCQSERRAR